MMMVFSNTRYLSAIILIFTLNNPVNAWSETQETDQDYTRYGIRQPTQFSLLANYVIDRGDDEQREFAIIALGEIIDAYSQVLQRSSQSRPRTKAGRKKQITWGWATSRMIASLNHHYRRLERGAPFAIQVDHLHRVLIIVDGKVVEVTGPRFRSQSRFEHKVVEFFCITRDCSWLEPKEPEKSEEEIAVARSLSKGSWLFQQNGNPTYVIGGLISYEFADFTDRKEKAALSRRITDEIERMILAAQNIKDDGISIDWSRLQQSQPEKHDPKLELVKGNAETGLEIALLSRLHQSDWIRLINWLQHDGLFSGEKLSIKHLRYVGKTAATSKSNQPS